MKSKIKEKVNLLLIYGIILLFLIGIFHPLAYINLKSEMKSKSSSYNQKRSLKEFENDIFASQLFLKELYPQISSDGSGGAIIVWEDHRILDSDIYAQYVNSTGQVKWTSNGEPISIADNEQTSPKLSSDGAEGTIIVWEDDRNYDEELYTQHINKTGHNQWSINGEQIGMAGDYQWYPQICSDDSGGAIIAWQDSRLSDHDIYAQRINSTGNFQWTTNDRPICTTSEDQDDPKLISDGAGGAFIVWEDWRTSPNDIYGQHINSSGDAQWTPNGVPICTASDNQYHPEICSDGKGGIIVTWEDWRIGAEGIYVQRLNSTGDRQWTENGVAICTISDYHDNPQICSDGNGGAIITWYHFNFTDWEADVRVQRVNSTGHTQWITNGTPICLVSGERWDPEIMSDDSGGAFIFWPEGRDNGDENIYGQRLNSTGNAQWSTDGVPICTVNSFKVDPKICNDTAGGVIVTWLDNRNGVDYDIYAQRVNSTGQIKWDPNGVPICTVMVVFYEYEGDDDDDDDDDKEQEAIPGYNLMIIIAMIGVISIIIARKFSKLKQ